MFTRRLLRLAFVLTALAPTHTSAVHAQAPVTKPKASEDARNLLTQAQELMRARQFDRAVDTLRRAIEAAPDDAFMHMQLSAALLATRRPDEALVAAERAVELAPDDARVYISLGNAQGAMQRYAEAIDAYKRAAVLDPDSFAAHNNLGIAYGTIDRHVESEAAFRQALRINPDNADVWNNLGAAQHSLGRHDEGIASVERAVRLNPGFVNAYLNLARWHEAANRYEESAQAFTEVTRLVPRFPTAYFERSLDYLYLGKGAESAADARRYLDLTDWHSERAEYMVIIAALGYRRADDVKAAKQVLDTAARRANTKTWAYTIIKFLRGEITADALMKQATDNDRLTEAHTYIGMDLLLRERGEDARPHFEWVKEQGNRAFIEYKLALAELDRLARKPMSKGQS